MTVKRLSQFASIYQNKSKLLLYQKDHQLPVWPYKNNFIFSRCGRSEVWPQFFNTLPCKKGSPKKKKKGKPNFPPLECGPDLMTNERNVAEMTMCDI